MWPFKKRRQVSFEIVDRIVPISSSMGVSKTVVDIILRRDRGKFMLFENLSYRSSAHQFVLEAVRRIREEDELSDIVVVDASGAYREWIVKRKTAAIPYHHIINV